MDENTPKRFVCPDCGGTDVDRDATAWWDEQKQDWRFVVGSGADDYCPDCGRYTNGHFVPTTDLKSAALVAINNQAKSSEDQHDNTNAS